MTRSTRDLLGDDPVSGQKSVPDPEVGQEAESDWAKLRNGVTVTWLHQVLRMDRKTARKRLANCPIIGKGPGGVELYDIGTAMSYLVKPKFDIKDYLRTMNPSELPPLLRKEYWDALLKQQEWEKRAGFLWKTDDVLRVLGEAFQLIKTTTQVWADDVERSGGLTKEQYSWLNKRVDALRYDLHNVLVQMPNEKKTMSTLADGPLDDDDYPAV